MKLRELIEIKIKLREEQEVINRVLAREILIKNLNGLLT